MKLLYYLSIIILVVVAYGIFAFVMTDLISGTQSWWDVVVLGVMALMGIVYFYE